MLQIVTSHLLSRHRIEAISRDVRVLAVGGGSEEIMSELAIREEAKDLKKYARTKVNTSSNL